HWKGRHLQLEKILHRPDDGREAPIRCVQPQDHDLPGRLDNQLMHESHPALERGEKVSLALPIKNVHRAVGAMLSGEIARLHGAEGLPDGTIDIRFSGSAGQSFGAFAAPGLSLTLEGEANDYVGKGLSGGRLVIHPPV